MPRRKSDADAVLDSSEASLLDIVDNVLNKGVVLSGDLTIALAQVDLIYARLSVLLCAADRVLPHEDTDFMERHHARRKRRRQVRLRASAGQAGNRSPM
ncbi:MAG TPA: gas vesicle protein [Vicinamibacterales bacterium]|nr:gas vesicle protein [Vicinamibacterales bacterium]